jgi:putative ABC transport system permease protein
METVTGDVRFALRTLWKNKGFSAIAIAALALGIGANTAIFTVVNAVLLQPLPYPQPERIMKLGRQFTGGTGYSNSITKYMIWRQNDVFESMALYDLFGQALNVGIGQPPKQVNGLHVSRDYFKVFGIPPVVGRTFTESEDLPNGPSVAVISQQVWRSQLNGDPQPLGRSITLSGVPYTVVGVMPESFRGDPPAEVWLPLQADPNSTNQGHYLAIAGRLKPGVPVETAKAEMKVMGERFRHENPKWMDKGESVAVVPMREATVGDVKTALLVLLGAVAFVLLIACANVANLLLARAAGRQREMAIRTALGANRWRVVQQLLTESLILAGLGAAAGFALGAWGVRALLVLVPGNIPRLTDATGATVPVSLVDWRVLAFTIGVALATGILFGLFPALRASNPNLAGTLKEASGRSGTGLRQNRARAALVVSEIALALVLLVGAALLIRTSMSLKSVKTGFDAHNLLTLQTSLAGGSYASTAKVDNLTRQVVRKLEALPGVDSVATTISLPPEGSIDLPFNIAGKQPPKGQMYNGDEQWRSVSAHYFKAFRIPLLRGRGFEETDTGNSSRVVIINDAMAKKYWPKEDPIGQVMTIGKGLGPQFEEPSRVVVGVVGNARETGLGDKETRAVMYIPASQVAEGLTALANNVLPLCWVVRTAMDPLTMRSAVEHEIRSVDQQIPIARERSMEQVLSESVSRQDFNMLLLSIFAGIALLLASIGIYGLMSYTVEQRTQEIGIRMALGAERGGMLGMLVVQGMKLTLIGVAVGLAIAYGLTRLLASLLFGVESGDPVTFAGVAAILTIVSFLAIYLPSRRAMTVEPVEALRYE